MAAPASGSPVVKKYYYAGNTRVAMRDGGALRWLLGDHLGSTTYTVNGANEAGEVRYRAFGAGALWARFTSGTTPTTYRYTGQREEAGLGLYYYGARWYVQAVGAKRHPAESDHPPTRERAGLPPVCLY